MPKAPIENVYENSPEVDPDYGEIEDDGEEWRRQGYVPYGGGWHRPDALEELLNES